jgi:hypothetical protein
VSKACGGHEWDFGDFGGMEISLLRNYTRLPRGMRAGIAQALLDLFLSSKLCRINSVSSSLTLSQILRFLISLSPSPSPARTLSSRDVSSPASRKRGSGA